MSHAQDQELPKVVLMPAGINEVLDRELAGGLVPDIELVVRAASLDRKVLYLAVVHNRDHRVAVGPHLTPEREPAWVEQPTVGRQRLGRRGLRQPAVEEPDLVPRGGAAVVLSDWVGRFDTLCLLLRGSLPVFT